jgi:hypothetical protein
MNVTVFLGPSMPLAEARAILPTATFRPPAAQGDLISCLHQDRPRIVALIDGTFHQSLSVWHTELCYLLSRGVSVYGSSSMGAIRAVETEPFGTIGVGRIFEWYRDGVIDADDEVALLHGLGEFDFAPLSVPLVNVRASMDQAAGNGWIDTQTRDRVIEATRDIYYQDRQITAILEQCKPWLSEQAWSGVQRALTEGYVDIKRDDARELLETIKELIGQSPRIPSVPLFEFNSSGAFDGLYNVERKVQHAGVDLPLQSITEHFALHASQFDELRASSLHRAICLFFANLVEVRITRQEVTAERDRFLRDRCLEHGAALDAWLAENDLSHHDFDEFIRDEALCSRLRDWILGISQFDRGAKQLLDELRRRGLYSDWAKRAGEETLIARNYYSLPEYEPFRSQDPAVIAQRHGRSTGVRITGDAAEWAEQRGFDSVVGLEAALRRAAVYHDVRDRIAKASAALARPRPDT